MDEQHVQGHTTNCGSKMPPVQTEDHCLIDFTGNREGEKPQDTAMTDLNTTGMHDQTDTKEEHTLLEELHRTRSNSSSSSDEEVEERGESKKRKKKGLKEKIRPKRSGEKEDESTKQNDTDIPMENCNDIENAQVSNPEEKKGFLDKIKEKLPGQHRKSEGGASTPCADEERDKKGILDKLMDKLPGHHRNGDEPKEKEN